MSVDRNVDSVIDRLAQRADEGLSKYGVTTERDDLDFESWLQHLQDELLDGAVYIAKLRTETVPQSLQDAEHWKGRAEAAEARCKQMEDAIAIKGGTEHAPTEDAYLAACRAIEKHRARIGRLETALRNLLFETKDALGVLDELAPEGDKLADQDVIKAARAALSDTAQQETDMMDAAVAMVSMAELEDLRERAAKAARLEAEEALIAIATGRMDRNVLPIVVMNAVKALPIDPETGDQS